MTNEHDNILEDHKEAIATRRSKHGSMLWMATTFILLGIVIAIFLRGDLLTGQAVTGDTLSEKELTEKIETYLNENVLAGSMVPAEIEDAEKINDYIYKLELSIGPQKLDIYASADGKYIFPSALDTSKEIEAPQVPVAEETPKTEKPKMDMFVMSQCPFGVQAEDAMMEVVQLLGDKIEYNIHYIVSENEDGTFRSLHGQPEADENIRQLCIKAKEPALFYDYLKCLNAKYRDAATAWEQCATDAGIDVEAIKTCAEGDEGKQLLSTDSKIAKEKNAGGSPTIEINGVQYTGARHAEGLKTAMCDAFIESPEECGETLGTGTETAGNC